MNPPTGQHSFVLKFLERTIDQEISRLGLPWVSLRESGIRTGVSKSRLPDLVAMTVDQFNEIFDSLDIFFAERHTTFSNLKITLHSIWNLFRNPRLHWAY